MQVGNRGIKSLAALTKLVSLNLAGCDYISDPCMPSLATMTQLQVLSLMWNAKRLRNGQPVGLTDRGKSFPWITENIAPTAYRSAVLVCHAFTIAMGCPTTRRAIGRRTYLTRLISEPRMSPEVRLSSSHSLSDLVRTLSRPSASRQVAPAGRIERGLQLSPERCNNPQLEVFEEAEGSKPGSLLQHCQQARVDLAHHLESIPNLSAETCFWHSAKQKSSCQALVASQHELLLLCRATLALQSFDSLEEVDLSETGIDDLGLQNLRRVKKLTTLNVSYTGEIP